jgi:hypothetical protein
MGLPFQFRRLAAPSPILRRKPPLISWCENEETSLEPGTLFIWLFLVIAPGVALLLLGCGIRRVYREVHLRGRIVLVTLAALALWSVASYFLSELIFGTTWGLAHARPFSEGRFPEGWGIYGYLATYSVFGATLVWILRTVRSEQPTR